MSVARDKDKPKKGEHYRREVHCFFKIYLVVNNRDYKDSPFYPFLNTKSLFKQ